MAEAGTAAALTLALCARVHFGLLGKRPCGSLHLLDVVISQFGLIVGIERKGIVVLAKPGVAVGEVPEGHAVDDVAVFAEHAEYAGILVGEMLLHAVAHCQTLAAELQLATHLLIHADVEFGHVDMLHDGLVFADGSVNIGLCRSVDVVVALHADTVDGHAVFLHAFHHLIDALALHRVALVVVVVEQQGVGVGLAGILESLGDELVAGNLVEGRLAEGIGGVGVIGHGLVYHVPAVYHVLVAAHDGLNVVAHTLEEHFLGGVVAEHPAANLAVPHQAVATEFDAVGAGEVGNAVGCFPVEFSLLGLSRLGLHVVLAGHAVEFPLHESGLLGIGHVTLVDGHTYHEIVFVGVFKSLGRCRRTNGQKGHKGHEAVEIMFHKY